MDNELEILIARYRELGIDRQIDYEKFYLYSIITHSTAIEGSTITELENQILFDQGISLRGKSIEEQNMNLDLKAAYERSAELAATHAPVTVDILTELASLVMKNTGKVYKTALGDFSSAKGELRLLNVTAGLGGKSYMSYNKVPGKLSELCNRINEARHNSSVMSIQEQYEMTFDAHYELVTIHPWADGNGRTARLLMNQLQMEMGLIPMKILKEDKEEYIKAIVETREKEDISIFRDWMTGLMIRNLRHDIDAFLKSVNEEISREKTKKGGEKKQKSREKIIELLSVDGSLSAASLAALIGITPKAVEKHLSRMKAEGILRRIGPDKGGHWEVI